MRWSSLTVRIAIGSILLLQVVAIVFFLLVGGQIGPVADFTSALAIFAYICMLPVVLLVVVVEGLWTWVKPRKPKSGLRVKNNG